MPKNILSSAATFGKNVGLHARRIFNREETPGEAWTEISKDAHKLKRVLAKPSGPAADDEAEQLVQSGRRAYNVKDYEKAEALFRQALVTDSNHCMAHTYLGYTLYKMGRLGEAEGCWNRAIDVAPTLKAGEKAREKLLHLQKKKKRIVKDFEDRLRGEK